MIFFQIAKRTLTLRCKRNNLDCLIIGGGRRELTVAVYLAVIAATGSFFDSGDR
jgi:hypothetical protein